MRFVTKWFKPYDALFFVVALACTLLYIVTANSGFPLDDSWIHQVYGRNLAQTGQWAFVPGVPSAASTSPLYTVLLSIGYRLNIPFQLWTHGLGLLALWITGVIGARLAEKMLPAQRRIGLIAGLSLILSWHLIWAAVSGMETMLFSMWTLALIALGWRELNPTTDDTPAVLLRGFIFGVFSALATITRPEGVGLAGLVGLTMLIVRPQSSWRGFIFWSVGAVIGFLLFIAPYLALNIQLTGGLLPDTAAAKQAENASLLAVNFPGRVVNMLFPLIAGVQLFLFPGAVYAVVRACRRLPVDRRALFELLPLVWAIALILLYAARLPAPYQHGRYVIPALPSIVLLGVVGTAHMLQASRQPMIGRVVARSLAISAVLALPFFAFVQGPAVYRQDVRIIDEEMVATAHWIADNLPPEELLAIHDIGAVGYFAPRPMIDLAGLVSPEIVPFITEAEPLWAWMQANDARYLMAFPDQIPGDDPNDPRLCPLYVSSGKTSPSVSGPSMAVYALTWDGRCP